MPAKVWVTISQEKQKANDQMFVRLAKYVVSHPDALPEAFYTITNRRIYQILGTQSITDNRKLARIEGIMEAQAEIIGQISRQGDAVVEYFTNCLKLRGEK